MSHSLGIARVYHLQMRPDTYYILVDRLWPRGIKKADLPLQMWAKDIAPSAELRKWFRHDPQRFAEFSRRYREELEDNPEADIFAKEIRQLLAEKNVILLYGAKSPACNHALVLQQWLNS